MRRASFPITGLESPRKEVSMLVYTPNGMGGGPPMPNPKPYRPQKTDWRQALQDISLVLGILVAVRTLSV